MIKMVFSGKMFLSVLLAGMCLSAVAGEQNLSGAASNRLSFLAGLLLAEAGVPPPPEGSDYLVVDLSDGPTAANYPVSYRTNMPSGGWTDEYKTTKMVFRRISAGSFAMGSPVNELGRYSDESQHQVALTQPFYIGVFEVTQQQWERVMSNWPSYFNNAAYRAARPVEQVSYLDIRGSDAGSEWPASGNVDDDSFMGRLRSRTGKAFDLPTEAQWEYAGRAGTVSGLNSGYNLLSTGNDFHMAEVGRYYYNGGSSDSPGGGLNGGTAKAGSYLPNAWGLYDFHGNAWEWCLDKFGAYAGNESDPKGAEFGSYRVLRGGCWSYIASRCRSAYRDYGTPGFADKRTGFRVVLTLDR